MNVVLSPEIARRVEESRYYTDAPYMVFLRELSRKQKGVIVPGNPYEPVGDGVVVLDEAALKVAREVIKAQTRK